MTNICHATEFDTTSNKIVTSILQIGETKNDSTIKNCSAGESGLMYNSSPENGNSENLCKHQYSLLYINVTANYLELESLCQKIQGSILKIEELSTFKDDISRIKENNNLEGVLTWIKTNNSHDFESWCIVLNIDNTLQKRPCHRPHLGNLCLIQTGLQVTMFGPLKEFDRNYTIESTENGKLLLSGHKHSSVNEVNSHWILSSNLLQFTCFNNESALPFVRLNWTCSSHQETLLTFSLCALNEFACSDGNCLPESERCDGVTNCPDASDEKMCQYIRKGDGFDVNQIPPFPQGNRSLDVYYSLLVRSLDDVKISEKYVNADVKIFLKWQDTRFELWDSPMYFKFECTQIWTPKLEVRGDIPVANANAVNEISKRLCLKRPSGLEFNNKITKFDDPYMGKFKDSWYRDYKSIDQYA